MHDRPRVVIVGGGFGGLWAARALARSPVDALLIDRCNYHTFLPLLYQVAASELEPEEIAYPIRSALRKLPAVRFMTTDVRTVNLTARVVEAEGQTFPYDFLILAAGSVSHFFGVAGAAEHAFPLKTLMQGGALRNQILSCFERVVYEPDAARRGQLLTFAIVGGGQTCVATKRRPGPNLKEACCLPGEGTPSISAAWATTSACRRSRRPPSR